MILDKDCGGKMMDNNRLLDNVGFNNSSIVYNQQYALVEIWLN